MWPSTIWTLHCPWTEQQSINFISNCFHIKLVHSFATETNTVALWLGAVRSAELDDARDEWCLDRILSSPNSTSTHKAFTRYPQEQIISVGFKRPTPTWTFHSSSTSSWVAFQRTWSKYRRTIISLMLQAPRNSAGPWSQFERLHNHNITWHSSTQKDISP